MPNIKKEIAKCKHPNSRKTIALTKQMKKEGNRKKLKTGQFMKQNLIAEKIAWFREKIPPDTIVCSAEEIRQMILEYLKRFDEELEQINIKHSIGSRKNRQHASREDIINMTKKRELEEFNTCGTELPDLLNPKNIKTVLQWNGELRFLPNIKMRRFSRNFLEQQILKDTSEKVEITKKSTVDIASQNENTVDTSTKTESTMEVE